MVTTRAAGVGSGCEARRRGAGPLPLGSVLFRDPAPPPPRQLPCPRPSPEHSLATVTPVPHGPMTTRLPLRLSSVVQDGWQLCEETALEGEQCFFSCRHGGGMWSSRDTNPKF